MRTITFKEGKHFTDPVDVGDILRVRRGNKWYTVIAVNEFDFTSCEGCIFERYDNCNVPNVMPSAATLCSNAGCVFKDLNKVMEDL